MIPIEAAEAAAKAAYEFRFSGLKAWEDLTPLAQCDAEAEMKYALLAAAPHIQAAVWEEGCALGLSWYPRRLAEAIATNPYRTIK